ncbi:MAG: hypothetical protein IIT53_14285 [Fibrobacter sp.]|nr:hypothetical protein [Fibrobacter sp.]
MSKEKIVILSTHIVSDIESIANRVVMIKDKHLHKNDTVASICGELDGSIFETSVSNNDYDNFAKNYFVLSARQERDGITVRFYSENTENGFTELTPNLEDVFLTTYR